MPIFNIINHFDKNLWFTFLTDTCISDVTHVQNNVIKLRPTNIPTYLAKPIIQSCEINLFWNYHKTVGTQKALSNIKTKKRI